MKNIFFSLVLITLSQYAMGQTATFYDFNTPGQLSNLFNGVGSTGSVSQSATGGIGNSGGINLPGSANAIFSTKEGYSLGPVGSSDTFESFIQSVGNSGYSGVGFTASVPVSASSDGFYRPTDAFGISAHGGGFIFHNGATNYSGQWNTGGTGVTTIKAASINDLLNNGSASDWYKLIFKMTRATLSTFDLRVEIWNSDANGAMLDASAAAIFEVNGVTNSALTNAPILHSYFNFSGYRVTNFDNFRVTLTGGGSVIQAGAPVVLTSSGSESSGTITANGEVTSENGGTVTERGFVYAGTVDPTIANTKVVSGAGLGTFTGTISGLSAATTYYLRAYATNSLGTTSYGSDLSFTTASVITISVLNKYGGFTSDALLAVDKYGAIGSGKGLSLSGAILDAPLTPGIIEVTSGTGRIWMDRNLGATQVAASSTDAASYGDLYQWGRGTDGHQIRTSDEINAQSSSTSPGSTFIYGYPNWYTGTNPDNLWQGLSGINNPCPSGYRLPTEVEWVAEGASWGSQDIAGASASPLKLPAVGYRSSSNGILYSEGSIGLYWSSTVSSTRPRYAVVGSSFSMNDFNRANGYAVRCIKETNIIISSATGKIWMDRNLGATQVATSNTDTNAYGDLYQWGRGTDGHQIRTSGTTSTLSSTDSPGNVGFITTASNSPTYDWRSPKNENLWQGVNGVNNPCPSGFRLPTSTEWNAEITKWISNDAAGAFAALKLPMPGRRYFIDGVISLQGSNGYYWSSTVSSDSNYSFSLSFNSSPAAVNSGYRGWGFAVRCIMD